MLSKYAKLSLKDTYVTSRSSTEYISLCTVLHLIYLYYIYISYIGAFYILHTTHPIIRCLIVFPFFTAKRRFPILVRETIDCIY
jgi:hypothetical protein